ncbi:hypothetical protein PNEG_01702 [Pneumocystis murina B123]|uniref:F-box domain-containing protein n=1 Tax=Pneumocystis murina (strain B123) TaxID=1069680 RepID=M7PHK9_PNEMU|nr:hypothetical protein PNEG_01702 [Pneumocystis murina B123]EMR09944.1 hypothetical protein PNEG_01702 [Pneumocystis murina B123]
MDLIQRLPLELILKIFSYLSHGEVVICMIVCKGWYSLATHPLLWKQLYVQKEWGMNEEYIQRCEEWARRKIGVLNKWMNNFSKIKAFEHEKTKRDNNLFRPVHITLLPGMEVILNWKFVYSQRYLLVKNWEKGKYVCYTIPRGQVMVKQSEIHQDRIYCIQFDRNFIVSGSKDKTIRIWDMQKGICRKILRGHQGSVLALQFDVNMNLLVSGSSDRFVIIWNLSSGKIRSIYKGHTGSVLGLCFDAKHIVTCSKDLTVRIWSHVYHEVRDKRHHLRILRGHRAAVNAVQLKNDQIVSASGDRTIKIWDLYTGSCLHTIMEHQRGIACLQFDGHRIVSGSSDRLIRLFDANSGQILRTFEGHMDLVRALCHDSHKIISGSYDQTIRIWDICSGKLLHNIESKDSGHIYRIVFDDVRIMSCGQKKQIMVYDFGKDIDTTFF